MPAVAALVCTVITQLAPLPASVPPLSFKLVLPAASAAPPLSVSAPPQPLVMVVSASSSAPGVVGKVSVNVTPLIAFAPFAAGLVSVRLSVVGPFGITGLGANTLAIVGGVITSSAAVLLAAPAAAPVCVVITPLLVLL